MDERIIKAKELAKEYKLQGYHCSESIIRAVPEALDIDVSKDVIRACCGYFGGGGGTGGRCGVVESAMAIISLIYGRDDNTQSDEELRVLDLELVRRFKLHFGSLDCKDIRPAEHEKYGHEFGCQRIYEEGAELVAQLILEAPDLLKNKAVVRR